MVQLRTAYRQNHSYSSSDKNTLVVQHVERRIIIGIVWRLLGGGVGLTAWDIALNVIHWDRMEIKHLKTFEEN